MLPLHLQPESHIPLYMQLRDQLRGLVHSGELRTGDRIPRAGNWRCSLASIEQRWPTLTPNSNPRD